MSSKLQISFQEVNHLSFFVSMKISGHSMSPYIQDGDEVQFEENSSPSVGNLVLCRMNGEIFIHRLCPSGRIKGDNTLTFDWEQPNKNQILGVVNFRVKRGALIQVGVGILQRIIANCSERNVRGNPMRKMYRVFIIILGTFSRFSGL